MAEAFFSWHPRTLRLVPVPLARQRPEVVCGRLVAAPGEDGFICAEQATYWLYDAHDDRAIVTLCDHHARRAVADGAQAPED